MKRLTLAILQLSESGELTYLRDKWWASSCIGADSNHIFDALEPSSLRGHFLLLGLGLGVGLLLSLLELLSRARNKAKDGKVGTSSIKFTFNYGDYCYFLKFFTYSALSQKSCCSVLTSELNQRFGSRAESPDQDNSEKSKA